MERRWGVTNPSDWEVLDTLWPRREKPAQLSTHNLGRDPAEFVNYVGIDADEDLGAKLKQYEDAGYISMHDDWQSTVHELGEAPSSANSDESSA